MRTADLLVPQLLGARDDGRPRQTATRHTSGNSPVRLPELGECRHQPVLLILLFDNSPSVTGGNDPVGNRFQEAALALSHYARRCRCGQELVALRTFDRRTSHDVGPVHLTGTGRRVVTASLDRPPELVRGTSRLGPSLAGAEQLAQAHPGHRAALVVFSDFKLLDPDPAGVLSRLVAFPGMVHAVVLSEEPPPALAGTRVVVSRVDHESPRGEVARAVLSALNDLTDRRAA